MARKPKTNTNIDGYEYYRTRLTIGHDFEGKPIRKTFYGKTKGEAEAKKKKYEEDIKRSLNPDRASQTLERVMYSWLWKTEKHSDNKSSTFERYESIYRNYIQGTKQLGQLKMSDINEDLVKEYYYELLKKGKTISIITNLNKLLRKFFRYAKSKEYIVKDPLEMLKLPKKSEEDLIEDFNSKIETFTIEEINNIIDSLGHTKLRYIIMFALLTGAREGEILALKKSDITGNIVKINKSVRRIKIFDDEENYHYEFKPTQPKTKKSNREVPLPKTLVNELKKLDILAKEEKLKLGPAYNENDLLFPSQTGTYIDANNLRKSWKRVLKSANVPYKKFHALRHTYATRLFENGTPVLTVSRLLGHSSAKTTEIYVHVLEDIKSKEVECLNDMFL